MSEPVPFLIDSASIRDFGSRQNRRTDEPAGLFRRFGDAGCGNVDRPSAAHVVAQCASVVTGEILC